MSALVTDEALRLWRLAFPLPTGEDDPLGRPLRRPCASAPRAPFVVGTRVRVRGYTRRRTLLGQFVERLPHFDTGKLEVLCRQAEAMVGGM